MFLPELGLVSSPGGSDMINFDITIIMIMMMMMMTTIILRTAPHSYPPWGCFIISPVFCLLTKTDAC